MNRLGYERSRYILTRAEMHAIVVTHVASHTVTYASHTVTYASQQSTNRHFSQSYNDWSDSKLPHSLYNPMMGQ